MEETQEKMRPKKYDPSRRGAIIRDEFGNKEKNRREIDLGLSRMVLPPITRRGTAKYRVIQKDQINPATGQLADPQPLFLPGSYVFYDKYEPDLSKRRKEIKNTTGKFELVKYKDGDRMEEVIEMVEFHNGVFSVNMEAQYRLYVFLELHPCNKTNRNRPNGVVPEFERIDLGQNRTNAFKLAQEELEDDAVAEIRALTKKDDIIGLAVSASIQTMENGIQRDIGLIKSDLRAYARRNPKEFFALSKSTKHAVRLTILEADSLGLIEYDVDKKTWTANYTDEPLHTVLVGEDPVDSFVKKILEGDTQFTEIYTAIQNMINYWEY